MPPKKDEKGKGGAKDKAKAAGGAKGGKAKDGELITRGSTELFELNTGMATVGHRLSAHVLIFCLSSSYRLQGEDGPKQHNQGASHPVREAEQDP